MNDKDAIIALAGKYKLKFKKSGRYTHLKKKVYSFQNGKFKISQNFENLPHVKYNKMDYPQHLPSNKNEDSDELDHIYQSIISLSGEISINEVEILLYKTFTYLDKNMKINLINELFSLIYSCFSKYPNEMLPILNIFLEKSRNNSNYIIITSSILSFIIKFVH